MVAIAGTRWRHGHQRSSRAFSGRLARGLVNPLMQRLRGQEHRLPPYPVQNWLTGAMRAAAIAQGRDDLMSLWAGQSAPLLRHRRAAELLAWLVDGVEARLAA